MPAYVKQVVELMIETRMEMKSLSKRNEELLEELRSLKEENTSLKERLASFENSRADAPRSEIRSNAALAKEDLDIERSIVLSHVPESTSSKPYDRVSNDYTYVAELLDYLNVEYNPVSVYRMGRLDQNRPRLIKVVLPSSRFQRQATKRAPRLRFYSGHKGVYLRPSLTLEERMRGREQRKSSGGVGDESSMRITQVRNGSQSSPPTANITARRTTPSPCNSNPTGNC